MAKSRPTAVVYCEANFGAIDGKTANGLVRHSERYDIVSVIDSEQAGLDTGTVLDDVPNGVPIVRDLAQAIASAGTVPDYFILGLAPASGMLSQAERGLVLRSIGLGMNVVNGLHEFLSDDPEFAAASAAKQVEILDVRKPRAKKDLRIFSGRIDEVTCPRIAVLGTDCAIGKRTTATILTRELNRCGVKAVMVGTGQTGLMQGARYGISLDAIPSQFCPGELESTIVEAWEGEHPDVIIIEGQGALSHPAYSTSSLILRGSHPDGIVLQHAPGRASRCDFPKMPMPTPASEINLIETFSDTTVIGLAINHENMADDEVSAAITTYERELGIPATDPLTRPPRAFGRDGPGGVSAARGEGARGRCMTAPRLEIDLGKLHHNARTLVERLAGRGISVTGVTKAVLGSPEIADAWLRAGVSALGDSRIENIETMRREQTPASMVLIRSPMLSQADRVVAHVDVSCNSELDVISKLSSAAQEARKIHGIVLMVELGDLREGIMPGDLLDAVRDMRDFPNVVLKGIGANLACRSGVIPDVKNMAELSALADSVDATGGPKLGIVSGGNSGNLEWALGADDVGRINNLRLGESLLLGRETLYRAPIEGLHTDAITLVAEVIESKVKPTQPWGALAQNAFGDQPPATMPGRISQTILAIGRQDTDPDGLEPPPGIKILAASSDHLIADAGRGRLSVGSEVMFQLNYSALVRAMTSPFVDKVLKVQNAEMPAVASYAVPLDEWAVAQEMNG